MSTRTIGAALAAGFRAGSMPDETEGSSSGGKPVAGAAGAGADCASSSEENSGFIKFLQIELTTVVAYHCSIRLGEQHVEDACRSQLPCSYMIATMISSTQNADVFSRIFTTKLDADQNAQLREKFAAVRACQRRHE
jgi:hypothetical protein